MSDFGLAANVRNTSSAQSSKTGIGTLNWNAPEVFDEHYKQRPERDIWSLGMIAYEVLARKMPYDGLAMAQLINSLLVLKRLPDMALIEGAPGGLLRSVRVRCGGARLVS